MTMIPKLGLGLKAARRILHGPLVFKWSLDKPSAPISLEAKVRNTLQPPIEQLPITPGETRLSTLAQYLSGYKVQISGATFEFIVQYRFFSSDRINWGTGKREACYSEDLLIGIKVLQDDVFRSWLNPWARPWNRRVELPGNGRYNGQMVFDPGGNGADFSSATHEGLGWAQIERQEIEPQSDSNTHLSIGEMQEDGYFRAEIVRQSPKKRKPITLLQVAWRHLIFAALEDLTPKLGYTALSGVSLGTYPKYTYLYDDIFKKRQDIEASTGNLKPLYQRVFFTNLPARTRTVFIFDCGDTVMAPSYYWVNQFSGSSLATSLSESTKAVACERLREEFKHQDPYVKEIIIFD